MWTRDEWGGGTLYLGELKGIVKGILVETEIKLWGRMERVVIPHRRRYHEDN